MKQSAHTLMRTTALTGACAALVVLVTPAQAATVNSVNVTGVAIRASGGCNVAGTLSISGTTADFTSVGAGFDNYLVQMEDSNGNRYNTSNPRNIQVGATFSGNVGHFVANSGAPRDTYSLVVRDSTSTTFGPIIGSAPIARADLIAAGGACRNLAVNTPAVANAGPDQTLSTGGGVVALDGTASSDADGDTIAPIWAQTSGPSVSITNPTSLNPSFVAPAQTNQQQVLTFRLSVTDGVDPFAQTDEVQVIIAAAPNTPPTVSAGPDQTVTGGSTVTLAGTANDPDNDPLTYTWTQTAGPTVTLSGANTLTPSFTAPPRGFNAQLLTFELIANDGAANSPRDTVDITVPANRPPVAVISAPANVTGGQTVTLDGSGSSDPDGDPLIYQWNQISGTPVTLTNPGSATPTFVAPASTASAQPIVFELLVADNFDATDSTSATITVAANGAPAPNAGPDQTVSGGDTVTLDGTGSTDPENDVLTYSWTQVSGPSVTLSSATAAQPTFTAPPKTGAIQTLVFELTVNDGIRRATAGLPDTVEITIGANTPPVPDAGPDQNVFGGSTVTLDGSGSTDADGDTLTYTWVQVAGPMVTLTGASTTNPTFTAPPATGMAQTLTFELVVDDGTPTSSGILPTDRVDIVVAANRPPVADAGTDQGPIDTGQTITLDGTGSTDPDGDTLTYSWTQISGTSVTLTGGNSASPTFTAPVVNGTEDLVFELEVSDGQQTSIDTVTVGIRSVGTITIVQRVTGSDVSVAYTSSLADLNASIASSGGEGRLSVSNVSVGSYTLSAADLSAQGYAVTAITCNDTDSVANVANRSVALELSPNEDLVCTFTMANSREAASVAISNFLTGRNALILANQPDLQRRLDRLEGNQASGGSVNAYGASVPGAGRLPVNASLSSGQSRISTSLGTVASAIGDTERAKQPFDIWAEAYIARAQLGQQKGTFSIFHAGADYRIGDSVLLGAMVSLDDFNDRGTLDAGEAEGDGWLAGPYLTAKLAPSLYAEVRAAWGKSENMVNPLGSYSDQFDTKRSYYSGSLIGQFDIGDATELRPEVTVRHISETQKAYVDSLNVTIPEQTVSQGDVSFRPRLHHTVELDSGWTLRPYGEVEGIYTFGANDGFLVPNLAAQLQGRNFDDLRARVEGGIDIMSTGSFRSTVSVFYDGIGSDVFEAAGVHFGISFGF